MYVSSCIIVTIIINIITTLFHGEKVKIITLLFYTQNNGLVKIQIFYLTFVRGDRMYKVLFEFLKLLIQNVFRLH